MEDNDLLTLGEVATSPPSSSRTSARFRRIRLECDKSECGQAVHRSERSYRRGRGRVGRRSQRASGGPVCASPREQRVPMARPVRRSGSGEPSRGRAQKSEWPGARKTQRRFET